MKSKTIAAMALVSTSFTSTIAFADTVPPPSAAVLNGDTELAMQAQCDALAARRGPSTGDNDHWTADVAPGSSTLLSGPTEVGGTRDIDETSITPTGTYVPGALEIRGNPYKTGGSVNMFGDQWSTAGYYPDSTYDFTASFTSTFANAFGCNINHSVYHPPVEIPAVQHPRTGLWVVDPDAHGNEEANTNNCEAFNGSLPAGPPQGGFTQANCLYTNVTEAYEDPAVTEPAYWDPAVQVANEAGVAVNQDQTDTLDGLEDHGGIVQVTGEYYVGKAVICISPGSKGGSWRVQNGYGGGSFVGPAAGCNTPYFKVAPWGTGSQTSQGTFTSVPQYNLP